MRSFHLTIAPLLLVDHPNIVKAQEVYVYKKQIYIIMQACEGGDLYTRSPYSEQGAARITTQLLSAINYMHDHGIVHRDLKVRFNNLHLRKAREDFCNTAWSHRHIHSLIFPVRKHHV